MQPFTSETGILASVPMANVDTDVIMPKIFLKGIDRQGLARGVFHDLRADPDSFPDFALNQPETSAPKFLVSGPNFGCGSSREHAVWGLLQFGVRAIIGTTFGGIFADNCANNGLLLLSCPEDVVTQLRTATAMPPCVITVDLQICEIRLKNKHIPFEISEPHRQAILSGQDAISRTLSLLPELGAFEAEYQANRPWLRLNAKEETLEPTSAISST